MYVVPIARFQLRENEERSPQGESKSNRGDQKCTDLTTRRDESLLAQFDPEKRASQPLFVDSSLRFRDQNLYADQTRFSSLCYRIVSNAEAILNPGCATRRSLLS